MTHICISRLTIIGSDNGLSTARRQTIIWTNAGILLIWSLGITFSEMLIKIYTFSFRKMHLKMSSGKWRSFCLGLNVLRVTIFSEQGVVYVSETLSLYCCCWWPGASAPGHLQPQYLPTPDNISRYNQLFTGWYYDMKFANNLRWQQSSKQEYFLENKHLNLDILISIKSY